jgi:hypothetical protein
MCLRTRATAAVFMITSEVGPRSGRQWRHDMAAAVDGLRQLCATRHSLGNR